MKFSLVATVCLALAGTAFAAPAHANAPQTVKKTAETSLHKANHIVPNCNKFYTILPSDGGCDAVAQKNKITLKQLFAWNKGLHHSQEHMCDNLDTNKAYCVGVH